MNPPTNSMAEDLTKIKTTLWGAYGTNGLNSDVKRHGEQIGDLYGRDETLRTDIDTRFAQMEGRMGERFDKLYNLIAIILLTVLASAIGIIATLAVKL